jgi:hypothetical protein
MAAPQLFEQTAESSCEFKSGGAAKAAGEKRREKAVSETIRRPFTKNPPSF